MQLGSKKKYSNRKWENQDNAMHDTLRDSKYITKKTQEKIVCQASIIDDQKTIPNWQCYW